MSEIKRGLEPVWDKNSKVLILGSFPSVKSRQVSFYYGNPQNSFWRTVCSFFSEQVPESTEGKKQFLINHNIALWDVVEECEIVGSQDTTIKNYKTADLPKVIDNSKISFIIINGTKANAIYKKHFSFISLPCVCLPSTSPANVRFSQEKWFAALKSAFEEV